MRIAIADEDGAIREALRRDGRFEADELVDFGDRGDLGRIRADLALHVLIFDWTSPRLPGPEICEEVRQQDASAPYIYLIAIVGACSGHERLEAYGAGADAVLTRPCDPAEVAARVDVARRIASHDEALRIRSAELEQIRTELEVENAVLSEIASSDPLTGLRNRRFFGEALDAQFSLARRKGLPISLVMIDVDQFKAFNDQFGHPAGDDVLREVGLLLRSSVRDHDIVARYGGEEFAIVLPATEEYESLPLADRLRTTVSDHPWPLRRITISIGVATMGLHEAQPMDLVDQADRALYLSKAMGRNRVTHSGNLTDLAAGLLVPRLDPDSMIAQQLSRS